MPPVPDPSHAPHSPLQAYYASEADRREWVRKLFDRTAGDYERMERLMALGSGSWYRRRALQRGGLRPGMSVVDVGVGTGLVAREAARIVGDGQLVIGVDPSSGMIANAKVPPGVRLMAGSAESVPVPPGSTDFLSMGYALRHISDLEAAFQEFSRVLRPGGRVCLLEITSPRGPVSAGDVEGLHARGGTDSRPVDRARSQCARADALLLGYHRGLCAA